jgi:hypothetical protein
MSDRLDRRQSFESRACCARARLEDTTHDESERCRRKAFEFRQRRDYHQTGFISMSFRFALENYYA